jgi:glycosyltransferase involved in cell wall biosynthesis
MEMGGSERLVHDLALNLDRKFFNPSIAWFFGDRVLKEFKALRVPLYHIPKTKRFDFSAIRMLAHVIKDNDIQIVNAHHFMSMVYSFYGCKIKNNIKLLYTEHSEWEIEKIPWKWRKMGNYFLNHSDGAVGVNAEVTNLLRDKFKLNPSKAFIIQNGVDLKAYSYNDANKELLESLNISSNDKVIGMVANFKKIKNHLFLLKAFEEMLREYKNVKLLLIGQGFKSDRENSEAEIKHFINNNGLNNNVFLLGFRSDIANILSTMDIFCLTSFKEGLPISLIEAMAAGLPVVGTDVEGIRHVIIQNINGFLVQVDDVKELKKALITLLQNDSLRDKMGRESRKMAESYYSLDYCVKCYQDLFSSLMSN